MTCEKCGSTLLGVTPTIDPRFVQAKCPKHGYGMFRMSADNFPNPTAEGTSRRNQGMARAEEAEPDWTVRAERWIEQAAKTGEQFTADDLTAAIGMPVHVNAVGPRFAAASRRGTIRMMGWKQASGRASQQGRRLAIWEGTSDH